MRSRVRQQQRLKSEVDSDGSYHVTICHRGEDYLYTDENGSTYVGNAERWNFIRPISAEQRARVIARVARYREGEQA